MAALALDYLGTCRHVYTFKVEGKLTVYRLFLW